MTPFTPDQLDHVRQLVTVVLALGFFCGAALTGLICGVVADYRRHTRRNAPDRA